MMSYDNYHNTTKVTADPDPVRMSVGQAACCTACARCALLPRVGDDHGLKEDLMAFLQNVVANFIA